MHHPGARRLRGFTLVEMLVVMAILAALAGIIVPVVGAVQRRSQAKACKALIDAIAGAVEQYAGDFGDFPPTSLADLGVRTNGRNEGAEALVRCLTTRDRGGPYFDFKEEQLDNTDDDALGAGDDPTSSAYVGGDLLEVTDPWGNPLIYFHHRDYRGGKELERYLLGLEEQRCRPRPSEKTGQLPGFGKFVIWSAGPDGLNEDGEGDDVCSWK